MISSSAARPQAAPETPRRRLGAWAATCIGLYVLLGLALIARVPLKSAPDEGAHFDYIAHIATLHSLPVFAGVSPPAAGYEFHQPPLYYLIAAPLWAVAGAGSQEYAARAVSLACGALTVWLVIAAARALFGDGERGVSIARRAGILGALWPLHLAVGASANNDALGGLCCAALFWRLSLLSSRAPAVRDGVWIGALCGLGLLSKSTTLTVAAASMLGLWHLSRRAFASHSEDAQVLASGSDAEITPQVLEAEPGRVLGAGVGVALLVCGWQLARNTILYGDALALGAFSKAAGISPGLSDFAAGGFGALYIRNLAAILFATSWGLYGGPDSAWKTMAVFAELNGRSASWPGGWLAAASLVLIAASTWVVARSVALAWRVVGRLRGENSSARDWVLVWWSVGICLVVLAWLQFAVAHFAGAQARYLHAAILPACVVAARAWDDLPSRIRAPLGWLVAAAMLGLTLANVLAWRTLV